MRCRPVFLLVLLAVLLSSFRFGRAETFRNPIRIPTNSDPVAILTGDVNGDGVPDILWQDNSAAPFVLHLLLGQHNGSYRPGPDFALPTNSGGCRLFDSNLDGKLDLVCASSSTFNASVLIFLGNGDATFAPPIAVPLPTSTGNYFYPLLSPPFDINGDALPDLIVNDTINNRSYVLLGDTTASYRVVVGGGYFPSAVADVNGDGKPDLLYAEGPTVALGNGDGTFGAYQNFSQPFDYTNLCAFHDMDGDGHLDAVCGYVDVVDNVDIDGQTHLIVLHGNADGTFDPNPISDKVFGDRDTEYDGFGSFETPLQVRDLNGDGIPDILAASADGFTVLLGGPHLTFSDPKHYAVSLYASVYDYAAISLDQIVDLNGDGNLDVIGAGPNSIFITHGRSDGTFDTAPSLEVAEVIGYATVADFNGDGIPDLVASGDRSLRLNLGRGDGTFLPFTSIARGGIDFSTPLSATNAHIAHGDFNGDGKQDILAVGSSSIYQYDTYLFLGHGDGTFDPPRLVPQTSTLYPLFSILSDDSVLDIDGDGRSDVVLGYDSGIPGSPSQIDVALSNGDGTFRVVASPAPGQPLVSPRVVYNYVSTSPAFADFDRDGKLDVAVAGRDNAYVLRGHGDGSFESTGAVLPIPPFSQAASHGGLAAATGDFDGDGNQDVAVLSTLSLSDSMIVNAPASAVFVYFGADDGTFSDPATAATFNRAYGNLRAADLNQDGRADLILERGGISGFSDPFLSIVHALPGRTFDPEMIYTAGTGNSSLAVADMNRDGLPDLVIANGSYAVGSGAATVLLNLGNIPAVTGTLHSTPEPSAVGQTFTLTASLTPPIAATLTGNVAFTIDGAPVGAAPLSGNVASITAPANLAAGSHSVAAVWPGDTTYPSLTLTGRHVVTGLASATTVAAAPNPSVAGSPVTFTAAVAAASPTAPTGSITLTDGPTTLATLSLAAGAVPPFSTANLSIGSHSITATYSGDSLFAPSSASVLQVVNAVAGATATALTTSANPVPAGTLLTLTATVAPTYPGRSVPTGTVVFRDASGTLATLPLVSGVATYSTSTLAPGTHPISATFSGTPEFNPSTSAILQQVVTLAGTVTALSATPNPAYQGADVVFSASVLAPGGPSGATPSGTVQFLDGSTPLATVPLTGSAAVFTSNRLTPGQHSITAIYSGAGTFSGSTSAPLTETILLSDFRLSSTPATLSLRTGHHLTFTLAATSIGAFADTVTLSTQALPQHATTSFPHGADLHLTPGAGASTPIYLDTDDVIGYLGRAETPTGDPRRGQPFGSAIYACLPAGLLALFGLLRRNKQLPFLLAALGVLLLGTSGGCSGKYPSSTAPGSYIFRISATGSATGKTHTVDIPLTISP